MDRPPKKIDEATVIEWVVLDETVVKTGKITMYHNYIEIDNPAAFAMCRYEDDPDDILVFYCDKHWRVLAAAGYSTIETAKAKIERGYSGTLAKWCRNA
ncbi:MULTISPECIES: hypothetical protein [Pseudomonas]|uniref:hypothetical protein n=1 Tax=Pseudomonadaceae TaxID=135621 RepID=UPI0011D22A8B|nr:MULTISPECIES: hypothetical protein [Pseudomonas]